MGPRLTSSGEREFPRGTDGAEEERKARVTRSTAQNGFFKEGRGFEGESLSGGGCRVRYFFKFSNTK